MSDMREEMLRTLDRIVEDTVTLKMREAADLQGKQGADAGVTVGLDAARPLWAALDDAGITALGVSGGDDGVSFGDTMELVRRAGFHALPVPIGDVVLARRVRSMHGLGDGEGLSVVAPPGSGRDVIFKGGKLSGRIGGVPWGRDASELVLAIGGPDGTFIVVASCKGASVRRGCNMCGEPRDEIDLETVKVLESKAVPDAVRIVEADGALIRSVQMSGALGSVLAHCMTWVGDRVQFGKPIAKHQAVQHLMAQLAEEVAAASAAADLAVDASEQRPDRFACAVAKARVGEAAGKAANLAHAVFGAMGFTREHQLHYATRRLWAWRNEFGGEAYWQGEIGRAVVQSGGGSKLWSLLTANG